MYPRIFCPREDCDEDSIMQAPGHASFLPGDIAPIDLFLIESSKVLKEYRISNAQVSIRCNATMDDIIDTLEALAS